MKQFVVIRNDWSRYYLFLVAGCYDYSTIDYAIICLAAGRYDWLFLFTFTQDSIKNSIWKNIRKKRKTIRRFTSIMIFFCR